MNEHKACIVPSNISPMIDVDLKIMLWLIIMHVMEVKSDGYWDFRGIVAKG